MLSIIASLLDRSKLSIFNIDNRKEPVGTIIRSTPVVPWYSILEKYCDIKLGYLNLICIFHKGPFKYHITLFWPFANPPTPLSHTILTFWFNPPPFSRVRICVATEFASYFALFDAFLVVFREKIIYEAWEFYSHTWI